MKAARIVHKNQRKGYLKDHRQTTLSNINWPNISQIIMSASLNIIKRATVNKASKDLNNLFNIRENNNPRVAKAQNITHKGPLNRKKTHFSAYGTELYNKLPNILRDKEITCDQFKVKVKKYSHTVKLLKMH